MEETKSSRQSPARSSRTTTNTPEVATIPKPNIVRLADSTLLSSLDDRFMEGQFRMLENASGFPDSFALNSGYAAMLAESARMAALRFEQVQAISARHAIELERVASEAIRFEKFRSELRMDQLRSAAKTMTEESLRSVLLDENRLKDIRRVTESAAAKFGAIGTISAAYFADLNKSHVVRAEPARPNLYDVKGSTSFHIERKGESSGALAQTLRNIEPGLANKLDGATQALYSGNPDGICQFAYSMRELLSKLLEILAPDDEVVAGGVTAADFVEVTKGKSTLTRAARLRHIYRYVNKAPLDEVIEIQIKLFGKLMYILNGDVHTLDPHMDFNQAQILRFQIEQFILSIVTADRIRH